jgi:hypothetical protein
MFEPSRIKFSGKKEMMEKIADKKTERSDKHRNTPIVF